MKMSHTQHIFRKNTIMWTIITAVHRFSMPKTSQVALLAGDWLRFVWKDTEEIMLLTKIKTSKVGTTYHVERAIHRTKPTAFGQLTDIYVNR